MVYLEFGLFI